MSGIFKAIGKVFKKVGKAISKVFKKIGKAIKKVFKSKIFKAVLIAAAIWFTAGTAAAYFAAPQAGLMSAMSTSASSMWSTTVSFFGGSTGAGAGVGQTGVTAAETAAAGEGAMITTAPATSVTAANVGAAETAAAGLDVAATAAQPGIIGKTLGWAKANPLLASTVVQGVGSVAAGMSRREEAESEREAEEDWRSSRGLYGQDVSGAGGDLYTGGRGLISTQMQPIQAPSVGGVVPTTVAGAPTAPAPTATPRPVPMSRAALLKNNNAGYVLPVNRG
jgi:hypothetical protein